jgi:hypothetical protein
LNHCVTQSQGNCATSEDGIEFKADSASEDGIGSMERNMRLGYVGLHYNDSELLEVDDLLEVIGTIEEQDTRTLLDIRSSTGVVSADCVMRCFDTDPP